MTNLYPRARARIAAEGSTNVRPQDRVALIATLVGILLVVGMVYLLADTAGQFEKNKFSRPQTGTSRTF